MRKIIVFNLMTLDGFFEGVNKEFDWTNVDKEFIDFANEQLSTMDAILFGRLTYQFMEGYWTTPMAMKNDPITTEYMNSMSKIVFSRTLDKVDWKNTRLIKENVEDEIKALKKMEGKDIIIFGSADLIDSLRKMNLIDEYRIMINPVLLGNGIPHFKKQDERLKLKLINSRVFGNGNVLLCYQPA